MMNLADILANPSRVGELPAQDLEQLATKYPQSEHVHLLRYLHHLHTTGEIHEALLAKASMHASNRNVLAEWTQRFGRDTSQATVVPASAPKIASVPEEDLTKVTAKSAPRKTSKKKKKKSTPILEKPAAQIEPPLASTWIIPGVEEELIIEEPVKAAKKGGSKSISGKKSNKRKRKKSKTTRLTKIIEEQKDSRDPFTNGESNEFLKWLRRMDQLGVQQKPAKKTKQKSKKKRKKKVETDIISETLAELVALQGRPGKAIEIYEQLRLKYPEKSAFFALKIKDLQDKSE